MCFAHTLECAKLIKIAHSDTLEVSRTDDSMNEPEPCTVYKALSFVDSDELDVESAQRKGDS